MCRGFPIQRGLLWYELCHCLRSLLPVEWPQLYVSEMCAVLRYFLPVEWPQLCVSEMCAVLRAGWVLGEPGVNACPAEDMLTRRHHSILAHTPTHTAQQALIDVAHKPLNIIPHSMETQTERERESFWTILIEAHRSWMVPLLYCPEDAQGQFPKRMSNLDWSNHSSFPFCLQFIF